MECLSSSVRKKWFLERGERNINRSEGEISVAVAAVMSGWVDWRGWEWEMADWVGESGSAKDPGFSTTTDSARKITDTTSANCE